MFANLIRLEGGGAKKTPITKYRIKNMKSCENAPKSFLITHKPKESSILGNLILGLKSKHLSRSKNNLSIFFFQEVKLL